MSFNLFFVSKIEKVNTFLCSSLVSFFFFLRWHLLVLHFWNRVCLDFFSVNTLCGEHGWNVGVYPNTECTCRFTFTSQIQHTMTKYGRNIRSSLIKMNWWRSQKRWMQLRQVASAHWQPIWKSVTWSVSAGRRSKRHDNPWQLDLRFLPSDIMRCGKSC